MPQYLDLSADVHISANDLLKSCDSEKEKKESSPKNREDSEKHNISVKERISK